MNKIFVIVLVIVLQFHMSAISQPFVNEIEHFKKMDLEKPPPKNPILFIGSSSFTNWKDVQDYFPAYTILNRAFGGSSLPHLILYAEDIIFKYHPKQIVIYCGENDLSGGPHITADTILHRFKQLHTLIRNKLPNIPIVYLSMKPSPSRAKYLATMREGNEKIENFIQDVPNTKFLNIYTAMLTKEGAINSSLFLSDSLHMNKLGYQIWQPLIQPLLIKPTVNYYKPTNKLIRISGRIDNSSPETPRLWASGSYVEFRFKGDKCEVDLTDEQRWGNNQNIVSIIIDNEIKKRIKLKGKRSKIVIAENLNHGVHHVIICKETENGIGYLQLNGILCKNLAPLKKLPKKRFEFVGNSITCGMGSDAESVPCKTGQWYDQHNAWNSYGAITARKLQAQWHLTSESGIGLIKSCCNKPYVMPAVFDKINLNRDSLSWNFSDFIPNLLIIELGQNDGLQDSSLFCNAYVNFIKNIRGDYPKAKILLLNSPMADDNLQAFLERSITSIKKSIVAEEGFSIYSYSFSRRYTGGCDSHPSLSEHKEMADEIIEYIKNNKLLK